MDNDGLLDAVADLMVMDTIEAKMIHPTLWRVAIESDEVDGVYDSEFFHLEETHSCGRTVYHTRSERDMKRGEMTAYIIVMVDLSSPPKLLYRVCGAKRSNTGRVRTCNTFEEAIKFAATIT